MYVNYCRNLEESRVKICNDLGICFIIVGEGFC